MWANVVKLYQLQNYPLCHIYSTGEYYILQIKDIQDSCVRAGMPCAAIFVHYKIFLPENNLPLLIENQTLLIHKTGPNQKDQGKLKIWPSWWDELLSDETDVAVWMFISDGIVRVSGSISSQHKTAALNSNNLLIAIVKLAVLISDKLGF